ncbi:DUF6644 family protein [Erythrobacter sp. NE805]|uniref:DUF6644 family protein n=1 Tax=Erythrobacter sp. NE805 TaxID=3389875 RepID=UPI00396AF1FF
MSLGLVTLLPGLEAPLRALAEAPWVQQLNHTQWLFAIVETTHLLAIAVLGGAVLILNLRLLGAVLTDVPGRTVEAATRPWLWAGTIGALATGTFMGLATLSNLITSGAFVVKMIALVAAIALSLAVSREVRQADAGDPRPPFALALAAGGLWLAALILFASTAALASGALLVALAGFALFAAGLTRYRVAYLAVLGVLLAGALAASLLTGGEAGPAPGLAAILLALAAAVGFGRFEARARAGAVFGRLQVAALSSSLAWITVAAAGRWIGFS